MEFSSLQEGLFVARQELFHRGELPRQGQSRPEFDSWQRLVELKHLFLSSSVLEKRRRKLEPTLAFTLHKLSEDIGGFNIILSF